MISLLSHMGRHKPFGPGLSPCKFGDSEGGRTSNPAQPSTHGSSAALMGTGYGCQCSMRVKQKLPHRTGHNAELVMTARYKPRGSEGPAFSACRVCALYPPAEDIREVAHTIALHHTGAPFPVPVPVDPPARAKGTTSRLFHRHKKAVAHFLEFPTPVV
jgi:hypothetical protein